MSQDLFAAFNVSTQDSRATGPSAQPKGNLSSYLDTISDQPNGITSTSRHGTSSDQFEDDDFGEFEDASSASKPAAQEQPTDWPTKSSKSLSTAPSASQNLPPTKAVDPRIGQHPFAAHMDFLFSADDDEYDAGDDDLQDLSKNPEAAMAYSKRMINEKMKADSLVQQTKSVAQSNPAFRTKSQTLSTNEHVELSASHVKPARNPNVLFDIDDVSDGSEDDDFGDFEDAPTGVTPISRGTVPNRGLGRPVSPNLELLNLNASEPSPALAKRETRNARFHNPPQPSQQKLPTHSTQPSVIGDSFEDDNPWDDFEESRPNPGLASRTAVHTSSNLEQISLAGAVKPSSIQQSSPPTNIPPPLLLLSVFPAIFASGRETLLDPLSKLDTGERQQLLSHPATLKYLQGYLEHAIVLGHVIAGRKYRWKRDQYLAQSMRIGPSAAGGKGGMKLAGVDKSEAAKEDREALDAVRLWKAQVGKLRGAVTTAASVKTDASFKLPPLPEIADQIPVKTLKAVEGGFVAPHACALCGLKREERASKVDIDVDDSFGEWWLDSVSMHLVCRNFWEQQKEKLRSR